MYVEGPSRGMGQQYSRPTLRSLPHDKTAGSGNRPPRPGEDTSYPQGPSWARPTAADQQTAGCEAAESDTSIDSRFEGANTTLEAQLYDAKQRAAQREVAYYTLYAGAHQRSSTANSQLCQARATEKRTREWVEREVYAVRRRPFNAGDASQEERRARLEAQGWLQVTFDRIGGLEASLANLRWELHTFSAAASRCEAQAQPAAGHEARATHLSRLLSMKESDLGEAIRKLNAL